MSSLTVPPSPQDTAFPSPDQTSRRDFLRKIGGTAAAATLGLAALNAPARDRSRSADARTAPGHSLVDPRHDRHE